MSENKPSETNLCIDDFSFGSKHDISVFSLYIVSKTIKLFIIYLSKLKKEKAIQTIEDVFRNDNESQIMKKYLINFINGK